MKRFTIIFIALLLVSCSKKYEDYSIKLPSTPVLLSNTSWAVVKSAHLRLRENPSVDSNPILTLWKGYVLEVISQDNKTQTVESISDYWYKINYKGIRGWVFGAYLDFYINQKEAIEASKKIKESKE